MLRLLNTAFGDDVEAMSEIFPNVRALRGVFDLLGSNMEENIALLEEMYESTGVLDEAFGAVKGDVKQNFRELRAVFSTAVNEIGKELAPAINEWLQWAKDLVQRFNEMSPAVKGMVASVMLAGPALLFVSVQLRKQRLSRWVDYCQWSTVCASAMGLLAVNRPNGRVDNWPCGNPASVGADTPCDYCCV